VGDAASALTACGGAEAQQAAVTPPHQNPNPQSLFHSSASPAFLTPLLHSSKSPTFLSIPAYITCRTTHLLVVRERGERLAHAQVPQPHRLVVAAGDDL
jgi:hypothetical protein